MENGLKNQEVRDLNFRIFICNMKIIFIIIIFEVLIYNIKSLFLSILVLILGVRAFYRKYSDLKVIINLYNKIIDNKFYYSKGEAFNKRMDDTKITNESKNKTDNTKITKEPNNETEYAKISNVYTSNLDYSYNEPYENDTEIEYHCEICDKLITEEEYEDFEGYCEDCYSDINVDYQINGLTDYNEPFIDIIDDPNAYDDFFNQDKKDDIYNDDLFDNDLFDNDDFDEF